MACCELNWKLPRVPEGRCISPQLRADARTVDEQIQYFSSTPSRRSRLDVRVSVWLPSFQHLGFLWVFATPFIRVIGFRRKQSDPDEIQSGELWRSYSQIFHSRDVKPRSGGKCATILYGFIRRPRPSIEQLVRSRSSPSLFQG